MDVAVVRRKREAGARAVVGGAQKALGVAEDGPLESVAVNAFFEVDVRSLLKPESEPGAVDQEVVEVDLPVAVLDSEGLISCQRGSRAVLRPDIRRDAEREPVRKASRHVD